MLLFRKRVLPWAAALLFVAFAGCADSGPKIVTVAGTLTHKGKPVSNAYVYFVPENGRPSQGPTDAEGRFKLDYTSEREGVMAGKHKVWVKMRPTTQKEQEAVMMGKKPSMSRDMAAFFDKYSQKNST